MIVNDYQITHFDLLIRSARLFLKKYLHRLHYRRVALWGVQGLEWRDMPTLQPDKFCFPPVARSLSANSWLSFASTTGRRSRG